MFEGVRSWLRRPLARGRFEAALDRAAELLIDRGELAAGRAALHEALREGELAYGPASPELVVPLYTLAASHLEHGELDAALEHARRCAALARGRGDAAPPGEVAVLGLLAAIHERGDDGELLEDALARWSAAATEAGDKASAATAENQLGLSCARRGDRKAAALHLGRARELRAEALGADALPTLEARYNRATLRDDDASPEEAARELAAVAEALAADGSPRARELRESALHNLGVVREEAGDEAGARAALEQALAERRARLGDDAPALRPTWVRLAQLHHRAGRILFAADAYDKALALARKEHPEGHPVVVALERWRGELIGGAATS